MTADTAALRALATAATPGPWDCFDDDLIAGTMFVTVHDPALGMEVAVERLYIGQQQPADAAYIAAASPDVVLALLDRLGALEAALGRMRDRNIVHLARPLTTDEEREWLESMDQASVALGDAS